MDFLKLVQKKEHKSDNKIIVMTIILVVLIMSAIVFWPSSSREQNIVSYLPENTSFYYHWLERGSFDNNFFDLEKPQEVILELETLLGDNFLNLQEIVWFQKNGSARNNYILRFSRLPKSFVDDFDTKEQKYKPIIVEKNILALDQEPFVEDFAENLSSDINFEEGISVFWQKDKSPDFLMDYYRPIENIFSSDEILFNIDDNNKLIFIQIGYSETKDIKNYLMPKDFDLIFSFNNNILDAFSDNNSMDAALVSGISHNLLKYFFDSLPYYNLSEEIVNNYIFEGAILWQKDKSWLLASQKDWQNNILDFLDNFEVEQVKKTLEDGTLYIELIASGGQSREEHLINGQKVSQIDNLFLWNIADKYYLSNNREMIEDVTSNNRYLYNFLSDCYSPYVNRVEDLIYIDTSKLQEGRIKDYLTANNIDIFKAFSYSSSSVSGINLCF